jgi:S-adenosylmethionine:tRNA ribosyltransferase-isomerase
VKTADFDYDLPPERIAQHPAPERTGARMLVLDRKAGQWRHARVADLGEHLRPGDLLVLNDTRVIPARVFGVKERTGGRVELLFLEEREPGVWEALCQASRRPSPGAVLIMAGGRLRASVRALGDGGRLTVGVESDRPVLQVLEEAGRTPLPPYIKRPRADIESAAEAEDRSRYQTVYARVPGAVAAPTAGLHFTRELLGALERRGIRHAMITLHIGLGTFQPVAAEQVEAHRMETERFTIGAEASGAIAAARRAGGRIVAVGSTVVRTLETQADGEGGVRPGHGRTALFIHAPHRFRVVDAMLTNFHLPRSTLLMMVCAFAGRERVLSAYAEAVRAGYRFYSYGDCMLIL